MILGREAYGNSIIPEAVSQLGISSRPPWPEMHLEKQIIALFTTAKYFLARTAPHSTSGPRSAAPRFGSSSQNHETGGVGWDP